MRVLDLESIRIKLAEITKQIVAEYNPEKIILFGSFAWGDPNENSDIDLLIVKNTEKGKLERMREVRDLVNTDFAVDILVYTPEEIIRSISEYKNLFIEDILRHGKVIYSKPGNAFNIALPKRQLNILH
ncbi:MAG: hypothetical protein A2528_03120 [Candidatus Staskawiczbacteria bacterium RIFOXYD2_FULL_37_9]|uniref:Polymerase beta nucleotidyltransferase domain-containing protein n=1 Tax=Candidatus Staskawiczbacteria bacterium RIFOXYB1_FULL_37_44 TaxID=1802223 RepID=A0A1G2IW68_9BACT|nr:MAG: hypothetical protein A2358_03545 [Candidatus Staskawiczbacteria bacterium RIFOXYB1_FULL_37_44]OGZ83450.1 MAG: hypothetical protein A2416_00805 [Candidatus Staskawiczbacteria bacterium RIFOXYC1_FULL_37_52]OGZ87380.1 MAG: hypothetical protein A2444_00235 [Candidatus Staskawiczbacteria bacterium RIFOXYC2_FULL_37_19]OGZ88894.1 MAG: hypothetical protein A2581_00115 [Candidatus Staskawiczbacteria bacterium RIFOXYD1_FULL_37_110]OGZ93245.1 MAG: hypothetical protein A2528_03120 [Candidatus Stask